MKNIFYILIAAFSLILHAKCVGQNNIVYGAGISYTNGVPTFVPPSKSARVAIDTVTSKWYEYATPGGWRWSGDRVQDISGCATPAYTPGKAQSRLVLNACTEAQNGHGPELYKYTGSAWLCLNCGGNYTAGDGIDITGTEITNTAPDQVVSITGAGVNAVTGTYPNFTVTGTEVDGSTTNEIQTLSVAGSNLSISGGNTVTLPTPASTLNDLTDVTITAPTNAQILQYNTATTQWVNATLAAITGSGTQNYIPKWTTSGTIGNSAVIAYADSTSVTNMLRARRFNLNYYASEYGVPQDFSVKTSTNSYMNPITFLNANGTVLLRIRPDGPMTYGANAAGVSSYHTFVAGAYSALYSGASLNFTGGDIWFSNQSGIMTFGAGSGITAANLGTYQRFGNLYSISHISGSYTQAKFVGNFSPASGTGSVKYIEVSPGINQTGGANGAVTGIHYNPSITNINGAHYGLLISSGQVGVGTSTPSAGSAIDIKSTTGVMVPPNMTSTQRDAIASPPNGIIFNTTTGKYQGYAAGTWVDFH